MPITEQEAASWSGAATADHLSGLPRPRISRDIGLSMLSFRDQVIHCFYGGPNPPLFAFPEHQRTAEQLQLWCFSSLERDEKKRVGIETGARQSFIHGDRGHDEGFLRTLGHRSDITGTNVPFLRVMFDDSLSAQMHAYVAESVRWMLTYGKGHASFIPILWAGLRDWETSSAWTRGKVLLLAIKYRQIITQGVESRQQARMNELLISMGLSPATPHHSLAHSPSLTARQARRSGVSQSTLRERWG